MTFSQMMAVIVLCVSVFLLAFAGWTFYRWRPKYFSAVPGYTRNIQHISAGKKVEIHVPGETTVCKAGSRHGPLIYYEIVYRVDGKEYMLFILETTTIRRSRSPFDGPFAIARKNHPLRIGTSEEFGKGICLPAQSGFSDYFSWFQAFLFCAVCNYVPIGVLLLGYLMK